MAAAFCITPGYISPSDWFFAFGGIFLLAAFVWLALELAVIRKVFARVSSVDERDGVAIVLTEDGRYLKVTWEILRTLPPLAAGQSVIVSFDAEGKVTSMRVAREESV